MTPADAMALAHDVNNVAQILTGCLALYGGGAATDERERVATIAVDTLRRLNALLPRVDTNRAGPTATCDAARITRSVVNGQRSTAPDTVTLEATVQEGEHRVQMPESELDRVITNLTRNAVQAVAANDGGRVTVGLKPIRETGGIPQVELIVVDDGPGIPARIRGRVFMEGFTTKSQGEGTGLGLATVRRLVADAGGTVTLAPGTRGTKFIVRLPAA